jgi:N-acylneuraminate cytidylyltransferase
MNIAYIPVRGGSKSIPLKNIKPMAGKPLLYWVSKAACACRELDRVYVATDSAAIKAEAARFDFPKLEIAGRSAESAGDTASTESAMLEFARSRQFTNIVLIQATSPLLTAADLSRGLALLQQEGVDSVLSAVRQKRFLWSESGVGYAAPLNYRYSLRPRRQEFAGVLVENGAFYITSRELLLKSKCRISGNIKTLEMAPESYWELDEPEDWLIVEFFLRRRRPETELPDIKIFLTDCDGTLTDGGMYYSAGGETMKKFNTRDGMGLRLLQEHGIITGIITGEDSEAVRRRAEKLGIEELFMGVTDKAAVITRLCEKYGVDKGSVAYIGDDVNDVAAIKMAGLGICVADAVREAKAVAAYVTGARGGEGAVREAAEFILAKIAPQTALF